MTGKIPGYRYIAEYLERSGVSHVFFVDAILRRTLVELETLGVSRILAHSEKAAAYMADGYARVSTKPGICFAQSVGAANLAAGMQDAYLHRSPVLAITGRKTMSFRHRNAYQEVDHAPLFSPVTKFRGDVADGEYLPIMMEQAFRQMTDCGAPRPVHLDIDGLQGELLELVDVEAAMLPDKQVREHPATRAEPDAQAVKKAAEKILSSSRPVLICGTGAIHARAHEAVLAFAEKLSIPVGTSTGGRGILPTDHPAHIGTVGTYSAPPANRIVHESDLVIFLGCHAGDQVTTDWTIPGQDKEIIQIDIEAQEIGRNYPKAVGILGDPAKAVSALHCALAAARPFGDWLSHAGKLCEEWRQSMTEHLTSDAKPIRPERLCAELSSVLPDNAVLVADTGFSTIWTATLVDLRKGQTFLRAAGSLGWAFPAAIGAQLAQPERPVVCFTGDGAFYYHLSELETLRRHDIPLVTVVNNNSALSQGLHNVRRIYGDIKGNVDEIIRFVPTDFAAIAKAFGIASFRVENPGDLGDVLKQAIALRKPVLIDVITDAEPRVPVAWTVAA